MHQVIWKSSPEGTITKIIERCDHHSYSNYDMYEIIEISYEAIITIIHHHRNSKRNINIIYNGIIKF